MLNHNLTIRLDTFGTALCSALSLLGSILVILSFLHVKSISSKPRAARLILNLALADCVWFSASLIQACFWVFQGDYGEPGHVPEGVCMVCSPLVTLSRISSLLWTCVIAFEAVQTVKKRKWLFEVENSQFYDYAYFIFVYTFALPGFLMAIVKQHTGNSNLGCEPDFEKLGSWYEIFFIELIPISIGFLINVYAFFQVRKTLSSRAFPRSVRKRRKRVMYHYIKICMLCWGPTILFYILEICGLHYALLEVISRILLYTTGFFNFLVFGMQVSHFHLFLVLLHLLIVHAASVLQDPHLNRSFRFVFKSIGLGFCCGVSDDTNLRRNSREKTVMFENAEKVNADISKDKRTVYRYHRLSKEEKLDLYNDRPDLNTKDRSHLLKQPLLADEPKGSGRGDSRSPNAAHQPIKSALKKPKQVEDTALNGKTVSRVVCADDRSTNSSSSHTASTDSSSRQALKIGSRDDEPMVSPNTSVDRPSRKSPVPSPAKPPSGE
jgi:hypothetical protein